MLNTLRIYSYNKCTTCRKAIAWLIQNNIEYISKKLVADMNLNEGGYIFIVCIYSSLT